jgi:hypothetical protein
MKILYAKPHGKAIISLTRSDLKKIWDDTELFKEKLALNLEKATNRYKNTFDLLGLYRKNCPKCGSNRPIPIEYGEPGSEMEKAWEEGRIQLGGCCIESDSPKWHCKDCKHEWGFYNL